MGWTIQLELVGHDWKLYESSTFMRWPYSNSMKGSWSNQAGPYQYYIHGNGAISKYLSTSASYKNPAAKDDMGLKLTIDSTAKWNSDMLRTELIPQTTAAINKGTVYYHFSVMHSATNAPSANEEHQVCFL